MNNVIMLIGRILLAALFILAGFAKLTDIAGTQEAAFSIVGMIACRGLRRRWARRGCRPRRIAWRTCHPGRLPDAHCRLGVVHLHARHGLSVPFRRTGDAMTDTINQIMFHKNLAMAGGFLVLGAYGAGALSVDARRGVSAYA